MQHVVHIFIGEELVSFRDQFYSIFKEHYRNIDDVYFTALSMTLCADGSYNIKPAKAINEYDHAVVDKSSGKSLLINYFVNLYGNRVTVANPGNNSMVAVIWVKLFDGCVMPMIKMLVDALKDCPSNIKVEIAGFTHEAVSCFIPDHADRQDIQIYKRNFDVNVKELRNVRPLLSAVRMIANRNLYGLALNLNKEELARVCSAFAVLQCENYLNINRNVSYTPDTPFESFGVSSLIFDRDYYTNYLRHRILIDKIKREGVDNLKFNINYLSQRSNPILKDTLKQIRLFYSTQVPNDDAGLILAGKCSETNIVAEIDPKLKKIVANLGSHIRGMLKNDDINIFESEALMALILGQDCEMFEISSVDADEITIDDLIDESTQFYGKLDGVGEHLSDIKYEDIKAVRNKMRNIADANRNREKRIDMLNANRQVEQEAKTHIENGKYSFGGTSYKLDFNIDSEPLELEYEPQKKVVDSIDLRYKFGPIRDQGTQGCCSSFAIASVIEAMRGDKKQYSPAFLYWNARDMQDASDDCGASLYSVLKVAIEKGVCLEDKMCYDQEVYNEAPVSDAYENAKDCRVIEAKTVRTNIDDMKSALSEEYPVIVAARIFDSFSETRSGFVPHPTVEEQQTGERKDGHGYHALVLCGYSDKERVFIARNSWGTHFGDNGYCYIPYSYAQKFIVQACIISKVSDATDTRGDSFHSKALNFNEADVNIEAAILQNLIDEDSVEIDNLKEEANRMKTLWTQNVGKLQNVNLQKNLVQAKVTEIAEEIRQIGETRNKLDAERGDKLKQFRHRQILTIVAITIVTLVLWGVTRCMWLYVQIDLLWKILCGASAISSLILLACISKFSWEYKRKKQELLDELKSYAQRVDELTAEKASLPIMGHIYGVMLRGINTLKLNLQSHYFKRQAFNADVVKLYDELKDDMKTMSPKVSYPFLALLTNEDLSRYYDVWRDTMLRHTDLEAMYNLYCDYQDIHQAVNKDISLTETILRGLRGFSMLQYVVKTSDNQWQFLPSDNQMSVVIPNIDQRATPFCPYRPKIGNSVAKYIFVQGIGQDVMSMLNNYFAQAPMAIATHDADMITILNIVRFDIPENL